MSFKNFEENIRIAKSQLKKIEIDLHIYIDGYHLFLFFDEAIKIAQKQYGEMFEHFQIGSPPILNSSEIAYSKLIHQNIYNLISRIEEKYQNSFEEFSNTTLLLLDHHFYSGKLFEKILDKNDVLEIISSSYRNRNKQSLTHYLEINKYVHFFAGGGVDTNSLIPILTSYLRNTSEPFKIERISRYINYFKTNDITKYTDRQLELINKFDIFKNSMMNFDKQFNSFASELTLGKTKFKIHDRGKFFVEFEEKAVDSSLIISALKQSESANKNSIFSIFTNDTDFLPLFSEVSEKNELYWLYGSYNPSKELLRAVKKDNVYNLHEFYNSRYFFHMHNIFKAELEDAFSKNKIEKFEDVPFDTLIDIYWELYNDIEWEIRMKENQKDMEKYYMSLLNEPDKND